MTKIIGVAMRYDDMMFSMPSPHRHHHIIKFLSTRGMDLDVTCGAEQGFLTSDGKFVNRSDAMVIARHAEQLKNPQIRTRSMELFSEDLW